MPELSTARLRLVPVGTRHLPLLVELNADPEVMRFIRGRAATRAETRAEWRERLGRRSDPDRSLGYWAGFEQGSFVGWWSASSFADDPSVSGVGYRLIRAGWGRGLATEGGRAALDHAWSVPGIDRVVASTMAVNAGSRRVLEKLGLTLTRTWVGDWDDPVPGWEHGDVEYELGRPGS